jgi:hypothetical protein
MRAYDAFIPQAKNRPRNVRLFFQNLIVIGNQAVEDLIADVAFATGASHGLFFGEVA